MVNSTNGLIRKINTNTGTSDSDIDSDINNLRVFILDPGLGPYHGKVIFDSDSLGHDRAILVVMLRSSKKFWLKFFFAWRLYSLKTSFIVGKLSSDLIIYFL